jgi:hypothetical protein
LKIPSRDLQHPFPLKNIHTLRTLTKCEQKHLKSATGLSLNRRQKINLQQDVSGAHLVLLEISVSCLSDNVTGVHLMIKPHEELSDRVTVRFCREDYEKLKAKADASGKKISQYVRDRALELEDMERSRYVGLSANLDLIYAEQRVLRFLVSGAIAATARLATNNRYFVDVEPEKLEEAKNKFYTEYIERNVAEGKKIDAQIVQDLYPYRMDVFLGI